MLRGGPRQERDDTEIGVSCLFYRGEESEKGVKLTSGENLKKSRTVEGSL